MQTYQMAHIRWGLLALLVTGVLAGIHILLRGPFVDPTVSPSGFAQMVSQPNFTLAWLVITAGFVLELLGVLALYGYLSQTPSPLAFWGMVLSFVGLALVQTLVGSALTWPAIGKLYLQGQTDVVEIALATFSGISATPLYLSGIFYSLGSFIFAFAIWRSGKFPKWSAIPYALHAPLLAFVITFATELLGAIMLIVAGGWMLWHVSRQGIEYAAVRRTPEASH